MKILTVIPLYPPHHIGGYEVMCQGVMDRLAEQGHEIVILTGETELAGVEQTSVPGPVVVRRSLKGWWDWKANRAMRPTLGQRLHIERHNQRVLREVLAAFHPDVASIWSMVYMSWSLAAQLEDRSIPIVLTFGDHWICYGYEFDAWTRIFDRRPYLHPAGALLGLSTRLPSFAGARASMASRMIYDMIERSSRWKFPDAPVLPMGVETRLFPVAAPVERQWGWRLLYVGRVVPAKGVVTLVRALALLPDQTLLEIDGHVADDFRDELTAVARSVDVADRIRFARSSRPELARRYRQADVVVFPSEWPEPFGVVPLEAMACAVPVVATGTGGSGEFLEDGVNCVLFPPGDAEALAAAVRRMAEDGELRSRIVDGGRQTAMAMNMDRYAEELECLHAAAIGSGVGEAHPR